MPNQREQTIHYSKLLLHDDNTKYFVHAPSIKTQTALFETKLVFEIQESDTYGTSVILKVFTPNTFPNKSFSQ